MTPRAQDSLVGSGRVYFVQAGPIRGASRRCDAALVDARECIVTDAAHTRATPLWEETNERLQAVVLPLLESGQVPVMGGFVGATRDGIPTTLGRGGSDFSASIVAAGLHAQPHRDLDRRGRHHDHRSEPVSGRPPRSSHELR